MLINISQLIYDKINFCSHALRMKDRRISKYNNISVVKKYVYKGIYYYSLRVMFDCNIRNINISNYIIILFLKN